MSRNDRENPGREPSGRATRPARQRSARVDAVAAEKTARGAIQNRRAAPGDSVAFPLFRAEARRTRNRGGCSRRVRQTPVHVRGGLARCRIELRRRPYSPAPGAVAAKLPLELAVQRSPRERMFTIYFCFCILTLAHFGHFHFRCLW